MMPFTVFLTVRLKTHPCSEAPRCHLQSIMLTLMFTFGSQSQGFAHLFGFSHSDMLFDISLYVHERSFLIPGDARSLKHVVGGKKHWWKHAHSWVGMGRGGSIDITPFFSPIISRSIHWDALKRGHCSILQFVIWMWCPKKNFFDVAIILLQILQQGKADSEVQPFLLCITSKH